MGIKGRTKNELKEAIVSMGVEYYELCGFPGWVEETNTSMGTMLGVYIIMEENAFNVNLVKLRSNSIPNQEKQLFYIMLNSLQFI